MFKRLFWLAVGVGLGFGLSVWLTRAVRRTAARYTPESVVSRAVSGLRNLGKGLREAIDEGREAMAEREDELRAQLSGREPVGTAPMDRGADPTRN